MVKWIKNFVYILACASECRKSESEVWIWKEITPFITRFRTVDRTLAPCMYDSWPVTRNHEWLCLSDLGTCYSNTNFLLLKLCNFIAVKGIWNKRVSFIRFINTVKYKELVIWRYVNNCVIELHLTLNTLFILHGSCVCRLLWLQQAEMVTVVAVSDWQTCWMNVHNALSSAGRYLLAFSLLRTVHINVFYYVDLYI